MGDNMRMNNMSGDLICVLHDAQELLSRSTNDFLWPSWENVEEAIQEIAVYIRQIEAGNFSSALDICVLFAPTGPIQDVSLSSGWGDEFLALAARFDDAAEIMRK